MRTGAPEPVSFVVTVQAVSAKACAEYLRENREEVIRRVRELSGREDGNQ